MPYRRPILNGQTKSLGPRHRDCNFLSQMEVPIQITFKNLKHSNNVASKIKERVAWLETFYPRIVSCRIVITSAHKRHHKGNLFAIRIDLRVPGEELVMTRSPDLAKNHKDIYVTIHDGFDLARRELKEFARRQRGE